MYFLERTIIMKKTISLVLAVLMLASAFFALPAVSAEMKNPNVKGSNQELLDMLNNLEPQQFVSDYEKLGMTKEQFAEIEAETLKTIESSGAVTDYDKLKAICHWVCDNIKYDYDLVSGSQDAYNVFSKRLGICQGYSNVTKAMCAAVGIPCVMVNGDSSAGGHAWSMAYADNRWIFIDNTWTMDWFDKDVEKFSNDHKPYYCDDIKVQEGDFIFTYFNGVAPCQYVGQSGDWVIPSSAVNMPVTGVSFYLFNAYSTVETLYIPETVKNLETAGLNYCSKLKKIEVAENNTSFASVDGVLFDKSVSNLLIYPTGKEETSFAIPNTIKQLGESVFERNTNLTDVLIPASVTSIGKAPFNDNSKITIYADEGTYGYEFAKQNGIACKPTSEFEGGETQEPVNKDQLTALVDEMNQVKNVYTVNSYREFAAALGNAADVLKDDKADQKTVDEAFAALESAYENLKYNMGDIDHSGAISIDDVTAIQQHVSGQNIENFDSLLADVDGSSEITITDATICQMVVANMMSVDEDGNITL